jgi:hypothetical protein
MGKRERKICSSAHLLDKFSTFGKENKFSFRSLNQNFCTFAYEMDKRTSEDYYKESKRIREEVLQQADSLRGNTTAPTSHTPSLISSLSKQPLVNLKKELRFNGLACRTNRGYPSEAEFKSASILASRLPDQPGLLP